MYLPTLRRALAASLILPRWPESPGMPMCRAACPSYTADTRRCRAAGHAPGIECQPAIDAVVRALTETEAPASMPEPIALAGIGVVS